MLRLFIPFDKDEVQFKLKVRKGKQNCDIICWYKIIAYWKFKSDFLWRKVGVVHNEEHYGKWNDKYWCTHSEQWLDEAEKMFLRKWGPNCKPQRRSVPLSVICEKLDNSERGYRAKIS